MATHVFIIDRVDATRALIRMVLRDTTFHVAGEANNVQTALQKLSQETINLVIVDHEPQGETAADGIRQLKEQHPNIVIVVASTSRDSNFVQAVLQHGAMGYIIKPFTAATLEDCLNRAWRRAATRMTTQP